MNRESVGMPRLSLLGGVGWRIFGSRHLNVVWSACFEAISDGAGRYGAPTEQFNWCRMAARTVERVHDSPWNLKARFKSWRRGSLYLPKRGLCQSSLPYMHNSIHSIHCTLYICCSLPPDLASILKSVLRRLHCDCSGPFTNEILTGLTWNAKWNSQKWDILRFILLLFIHPSIDYILRTYYVLIT